MSAMEITFDAYYKHESYSFEYVTNVMIGDLQRIIEYPKRGFQIEQDVPENVKEAFEGLVIRGYTEHLL
jgi:hypothetical protein